MFVSICIHSSPALLQEGGPLPGLKTGLSKTQKWIVHGDMCADKARDFIGKEHPLGEQEGEGTQENSCRGCSLEFYGDGISFWVVLSQSFWLRVLPSRACLVQPRWMSERIVVGGWTCGVSFWPFLNSSGWWWLILSMFLTRTSCHKATHANGSYGAWPWWAVSVGVLPLLVWNP